jgi:hypothetical protein
VELREVVERDEASVVAVVDVIEVTVDSGVEVALETGAVALAD